MRLLQRSLLWENDNSDAVDLFFNQAIKSERANRKSIYLQSVQLIN